MVLEEAEVALAAGDFNPFGRGEFMRVMLGGVDGYFVFETELPKLLTCFLTAAF